MTKETTKEELAKVLEGMEYRANTIFNMENVAKKNNLVIVYGASDDLIEIRGAIEAEVGCYNGGTFYISQNGLLEVASSYECQQCKHYKASYEAEKEKCHELKALWGKGKWDWSYEIDVHHVKFHIYDEGERYCEGIIFDLEALA